MIITAINILLLLGLVTFIVGPKKVPFHARQAGHLTGQLTLLIRQGVQIYQKVQKDKDFSNIAKDIQAGMQQLEKVKRDLDIGQAMLRNPIKMATFAAQMAKSPSAAQDVTDKAETSNQDKSETSKQNKSQLAKQDSDKEIKPNVREFVQQLKQSGESKPHDEISGAFYVSKIASYELASNQIKVNKDDTKKPE